MATKDVVDILLLEAARRRARSPGIQPGQRPQDRPVWNKGTGTVRRQTSRTGTRMEPFMDGTWKRLINPPNSRVPIILRADTPLRYTESTWNRSRSSCRRRDGSLFRLVGPVRPADFLQRTLTGVGDDWPIRYRRSGAVVRLQ